MAILLRNLSSVDRSVILKPAIASGLSPLTAAENRINREESQIATPSTPIYSDARPGMTRLFSNTAGMITLAFSVLLTGCNSQETLLSLGIGLACGFGGSILGWYMRGRQNINFSELEKEEPIEDAKKIGNPGETAELRRILEAEHQQQIQAFRQEANTEQRRLQLQVRSLEEKLASQPEQLRTQTEHLQATGIKVRDHEIPQKKDLEQLRDSLLQTIARFEGDLRKEDTARLDELRKNIMDLKRAEGPFDSEWIASQSEKEVIRDLLEMGHYLEKEEDLASLAELRDSIMNRKVANARRWIELLNAIDSDENASSEANRLGIQPRIVKVLSEHRVNENRIPVGCHVRDLRTDMGVEIENLRTNLYPVGTVVRLKRRSFPSFQKGIVVVAQSAS